MCSHYEILFLSKKAANISAGATPLSYTSEGKITSAFEGEAKQEIDKKKCTEYKIQTP